MLEKEAAGLWQAVEQGKSRGRGGGGGGGSGGVENQVERRRASLSGSRGKRAHGRPGAVAG